MNSNLIQGPHKHNENTYNNNKICYVHMNCFAQDKIKIIKYYNYNNVKKGLNWKENSCRQIVFFVVEKRVFDLH